MHVSFRRKQIKNPSVMEENNFGEKGKQGSDQANEQLLKIKKPA
jgi:hypothetical protein